MKFDIIMLFLLLYAVLYLIGGARGAQLYQETPQLNISNYLDSEIENMSLTSMPLNCPHIPNREEMVLCNFRMFVKFSSYQSYGMGAEFGFANSWIGPVGFSVMALLLMAIFFFSDNLSFILIPIALAIITKDWISEKLKEAKT